MCFSVFQSWALFLAICSSIFHGFSWFFHGVIDLPKMFINFSIVIIEFSMGSIDFSMVSIDFFMHDVHDERVEYRLKHNRVGPK